MQKAITVSDHIIGVEDLNLYLENGWRVIDTFTLHGGRLFLIEESIQEVPETPVSTGLIYKGEIELNHPLIPQGSIIVSPNSNNTYKIIKKTKQS